MFKRVRKYNHYFVFETSDKDKDFRFSRYVILDKKELNKEDFMNVENLIKSEYNLSNNMVIYHKYLGRVKGVKKSKRK